MKKATRNKFFYDFVYVVLRILGNLRFVNKRPYDSYHTFYDIFCDKLCYINKYSNNI